MGRHIRGWYGLSNCHGSQQSWIDELPSDWDTRNDEEQAAYLEEMALETLYNVLDCGAEVVEDGAR